ncbi:MAG: hypothetical protein AAF415_17480 [Pseudomonadota bacterium]
MTRLLALAVALSLTACAQTARDPDAGYPLLYAVNDSEEIRADSILILQDGSTRWAPFSRGATEPISENRVDLGSTPLIGKLFGRRIAPGDARRDGAYLGPVYRAGTALAVDIQTTDERFQELPVSIATNLQLLGPVRYELGLLPYRTAQEWVPSGPVIGRAFRVGDRLVIASEGDLPAIADLYDLFPYQN